MHLLPMARRSLRFVPFELDGGWGSKAYEILDGVGLLIHSLQISALTVWDRQCLED